MPALRRDTKRYERGSVVRVFPVAAVVEVDRDRGGNHCGSLPGQWGLCRSPSNPPCHSLPVPSILIGIDTRLRTATHGTSLAGPSVLTASEVGGRTGSAQPDLPSCRSILQGASRERS
jgi:hypothetical protein